MKETLKPNNSQTFELSFQKKYSESKFKAREFEREEEDIALNETLTENSENKFLCKLDLKERASLLPAVFLNTMKLINRKYHQN